MEKVVNKYICLLSLVFLFFGGLSAQNTQPPLERNISIELNNVSTVELLKLLEVAGGFTFAYQTDIINPSVQLSRRYINKTTREILDDVFQGALTYKEKGNYVLLRTSPKLQEQELNLEGYTINNLTDEKVPFVTIFDSLSLASTVSDAYGHYSFKLIPTNVLDLTTKKIGFKDTTFRCTGSGNMVLNIRIVPEIKSVTEEKDTLDFLSRLKNLKFFNPDDIAKANLQNFKERLKRNSQFSVIPFVGTNGALSGSTDVDFSFNLLGGFNGGVRMAELGGLFNIVWDSVSYVQAAGLFNVVGGVQRGVQIAGLSNFNNSTFTGIQYSGWSNFVRDDFFGVQTSGFVNMAMANFTGVQISGFLNYIKDTSAVVQWSGFANYAGKYIYGTQVAGFTNIAQGYKGAQIAGFSNQALGAVKGAQVAGFMNTAAGNIEGAQVSGFLNIAPKVKGAQIGFINISDTIDGIPIGFFSYSKKGYHQLELSANEITPLNLAFRTGGYKFYNIFTAGISPEKNNEFYWSYGYGIGSSVSLTKRSSLFFDLQSSNILNIKSGYQLSLLNKFAVTYQFSLTNKIALAIGSSYNVFLVDNAGSQSGMQLSNLAPYSFQNLTTNGDMKIKMWAGGHLALRMF